MIKKMGVTSSWSDDQKVIWRRMKLLRGVTSSDWHAIH